jgi:hypothetical protein
MEEEKIIERGLMAEAMMHDENFQNLYEIVENELARGILATSVDDKARREELYVTYQGLRYFTQLINGYRLAKDQIIEKRDAEITQEDD